MPSPTMTSAAIPFAAIRNANASQDDPSLCSSRSDRTQFALLSAKDGRYRSFARDGLGRSGAGTHPRRPPDFPPTTQQSGGRAPAGAGLSVQALQAREQFGRAGHTGIRRQHRRRDRRVGGGMIWTDEHQTAPEEART